jgi:carboxyl-terminal processing protease
MTKVSRAILLIASALVVIVLLGGGFALRVGAAESSYRQPARFAEILSLVMENYVDEVAMDGLLQGAYQGMLGGLDPNGAFLTPGEVAEWRSGGPVATAWPGIGVLRLGRSLQVVSIAPESPAEEVGIEVGDQIRSIDERMARELSLAQARRILGGEPGSSVKLEIFRPHDNFRRLNLEVPRAPRKGRVYDLSVTRGTAVLELRDLERLAIEDLRQELDDVRSRGVERLLIDLRDFAEGSPRQIAAFAGIFAGEGTLLRLRDGSGRQVEVVENDPAPDPWVGSLAVLVNGASAGAAEALAALAREMGGGEVYGEATYGLGAEPRLYELEGGYGLLVSATRWETANGGSWNRDGVEPDHLIRGSGADHSEVLETQLEQVLDLLEDEPQEADAPARAA